MLAQQLLNGIMLGGLYALLAVGFAVVFSLLRVINFGYGAVFMVGAYITAITYETSGAPFLLAVVIGAIVAGMLNIVVERLGVAPLRRGNQPTWYAMITTFALALIIENVSYRIFGTDYRAFASPFGVRTYSFLGATATNLQFLVLLCAVILMGLLVIFVRFTWMGRAFRAVAQDSSTASLMGVNVDLVVALGFFISGVLAGLAGVLVAMYQGLISVNMGLGVGLRGFIGSLLGGMGSIPGAMLGGLILGLVEALSVAFISANVKGVVSFVVLILVLLWRPNGLLGKESL
jgi:branched-chain amino acid transport system permease protein